MIRTLFMIHLPTAAFSVFLSFRNFRFLFPPKQPASHCNSLLSVSTVHLLVSFISTRPLPCSFPGITTLAITQLFGLSRSFPLPNFNLKHLLPSPELPAPNHECSRETVRHLFTEAITPETDSLAF